jgi:hypothetical protein
VSLDGYYGRPRDEIAELKCARGEILVFGRRTL